MTASTARACLMLLLTATLAAPASAQRPHYDGSESDLALLSVNVVLGGASSGLVALLRGHDPLDAFATGALGGGISFAGKRIATADFTASGLLGRQVAAVGHAMVVNGGRAAPLLSEIWLPIGPLQLRIPSGARERGPAARLDVTSAAALLYAATIPELELDWSASLERGAAVFVAPDHRIRFDGEPYYGITAPGVIVIGGDVEDGSVLEHEMVHVIQLDLMALAWSYPLEAWAREGLLPDQEWLRAFPLGAVGPGLTALLYQITDGGGFISALMESEAYSLTRGRSERQLF